MKVTRNCFLQFEHFVRTSAEDCALCSPAATFVKMVVDVALAAEALNEALCERNVQVSTGRERQAVVPLDDPGILRCPTIGNCR